MSPSFSTGAAVSHLPAHIHHHLIACLAREMQESLGHALVLVNVKLEVAQRLYAVDIQRGDGELEATRALVRATMAGLRCSLANLRAERRNDCRGTSTLRIEH